MQKKTDVNVGLCMHENPIRITLIEILLLSRYGMHAIAVAMTREQIPSKRCPKQAKFRAYRALKP